MKLLKVLALLGLTSYAFAGPSQPPAGNYILNVSTIASKPAFNVFSGTITNINILGTCSGPGCGTGGGGGSTNGTIIASPQFRIPYYSLSGTTTTITGSPSITFQSGSGVIVDTMTVSSMTVNVSQTIGSIGFPNAASIVYNGVGFTAYTAPTPSVTPIGTLTMTKTSINGSPIGFRFDDTNGAWQAGINPGSGTGNGSIRSRLPVNISSAVAVTGGILVDSFTATYGVSAASINVTGVSDASIIGTIGGNSYSTTWSSTTATNIVGQCAVFSGTNTVISAACGSGGGGSPGGSNAQFQYNNSGSFGGTPLATVDASSISFNSISSMTFVGFSTFDASGQGDEVLAYQLVVGSPTDTSFGSNPYMTINTSGTASGLLVVPQGFVSGGYQTRVGAVTIGDANPLRPFSTELVLIDSSTDAQGGGGMLELWSSNPNHNDPKIWFHVVGHDSSPEIRDDANAPNWEMINTSTDNTHGYGKFEPAAVAYQGIDLQVNSRSYDNTTFENLAYWHPLQSAKSGLYLQVQSLTNDSGVLASSDTSVVRFGTQNGHVIGITGPLNTSASWDFRLPATSADSGQVMYESVAGDSFGDRDLAFTSGGSANQVLTNQGSSAPTWQAGGLLASTETWTAKQTFSFTQAFSSRPVSNTDFAGNALTSAGQFVMQSFPGPVGGVGQQMNGMYALAINTGTATNAGADYSGGFFQTEDTVNGQVNAIAVFAQGIGAGTAADYAGIEGEGEWISNFSGGISGTEIDGVLGQVIIENGATTPISSGTAADFRALSKTGSGSPGNSWTFKGDDHDPSYFLGSIGVGISTANASLQVFDTSNKWALAVSTFNGSSWYTLGVSSSPNHLNNDQVVAGTATVCGTGPTLNTLCSDNSCSITAGTGATGCTFTFNQAYIRTPVCVVSSQAGSITNAFSYSYTNSAITVTETGLGGHLWDFICWGKDN